MPSCTRTSLFLAGLLCATPAVAQDDDDWLFEDDEDVLDAEDDAEEGEEEWMEDFGDEEDDSDNFEDDDDFFDEEEELRPREEGEDTADIYRAHVDEVRGLPADEESLAWERYLRKYPNTSFGSRIDERLTVLEREMFGGGIEGPGSASSLDAGRAELHFAQPVSLENIDPITKLRLGFEIGLPDYTNFIADFEYQIFRELSVHAGIRNRFSPGNSFELGARYALIKSARTKTLLTVIGDVRSGTVPFYPALRPQLAFGQQLTFGEISLDVQVQGGTDMTFIQGSGGEAVFEPRLVGGANVTLIPNDRVRVFAETSTYMKDLGFEGGAFSFNQLTFGLKIMGRDKTTDDLKFEIGAAANAPYLARYWGYHLGAVSADMNYYLDL
ncbi:MAG: hypothetical protein ACI8S6_001180 [Myxococcota bacterium]|jgi:hypothetical protein